MTNPIPTFACVGSRKAPPEVLDLLERFCRMMTMKGWIMVSGGADGCDEAGEKGALPDKRIIFLPWNKFRGKKVDYKSYFVPPITEASMKLVKLHPKFNKLSDAAFKLMNRNGYQALGYDLKTPVRFGICWTENGEEVGGTAQFLRIAKLNNIRVINIGNESDFNRIKIAVERYEEGLS